MYLKAGENMESSGIAVGKQVMFINKAAHKREPKYYPSYGTIGTVLKVFMFSVLVQWPENETFGDGSWYCGKKDVVAVNKRSVKCV